MRVISGKVKGLKLLAPKGLETRPTTDRVKESIFNIIQFYIVGKKVLDLFAGTGALGMEALSRGAKEAVFVDSSAEAQNIIKKNVERARFQDISVLIKRDVLNFLEDQASEKYDLVFMDPPYQKGLGLKALNILVTRELLNENAIIIIETSAEEEMPVELENIFLQKSPKYGNTKIWIYKKGLGGF